MRGDKELWHKALGCSLIAAISAVLAGCPWDSDPAGSIRVNVATSGAIEEIHGFSVTLDDAQSKPISSNGSAVFKDISVASHSVELSGVPQFCSVASDNPQVIAVRDGDESGIEFGVTCTSQGIVGTIIASVRTVGSDFDSDGYALNLDGGSSVPVQPNDEVTFGNLSQGSHTLLVSNIAQQCTVTGDNPKAVTVTSDAAVHVAIEVRCSAQSGGATPVVIDVEVPLVSTAPGASTVGRVSFSDADGDVVRAVFTRVSDPGNALSSSFTVPVSPAQATSGAFSFTLRCPGPATCRSGIVGVVLTLEDAQGHVSEGVGFSLNFGPPLPPPDLVLSVPLVPQQTRVWCWAAVSEMVFRYYGSGAVQCQIVSRWLGLNCCVFNPFCEVTAPSLEAIQQVLSTFGNLNSSVLNAPLSFQQVQVEIAAGRPIIAAYQGSFAGHVVVIFGYDHSGNIYINDPSFGNFIVPYSSSFIYNGQLRWVQTIYNIRPLGAALTAGAQRKPNSDLSKMVDMKGLVDRVGLLSVASHEATSVLQLDLKYGPKPNPATASSSGEVLRLPPAGGSDWKPYHP